MLASSRPPVPARILRGTPWLYPCYYPSTCHSSSLLVQLSYPLYRMMNHLVLPFILLLLPLLSCQSLSSAFGIFFDLFCLIFLPTGTPDIWEVIEACTTGTISSCHTTRTLPRLEGVLGPAFAAGTPPPKSVVINEGGISLLPIHNFYKFMVKTTHEKWEKYHKRRSQNPITLISHQQINLYPSLMVFLTEVYYRGHS